MYLYNKQAKGWKREGKKPLNAGHSENDVMNLIFIFVLVDMPEEISANKSKKLKAVQKHSSGIDYRGNFP